MTLSNFQLSTERQLRVYRDFPARAALGQKPSFGLDHQRLRSEFLVYLNSATANFPVELLTHKVLGEQGMSVERQKIRPGIINIGVF